uniref:Uncharacterized protein n=1 Tax=Palpitomonas bilix TaxID=652834 RepID=A0A7S3G409_9EUKA|mmetsp:Transcript_17287/g.43103  ORF Transcript_17287/g.43103 Transcript_17287/m.43103 type:complete len:379 (+) Transcript_17287:297-1433(+)
MASTSVIWRSVYERLSGLGLSGFSFKRFSELVSSLNPRFFKRILGTLASLIDGAVVGKDIMRADSLEEAVRLFKNLINYDDFYVLESSISNFCDTLLGVIDAGISRAQASVMLQSENAKECMAIEKSSKRVFSSQTCHAVESASRMIGGKMNPAEFAAFFLSRAALSMEDFKPLLCSAELSEDQVDLLDVLNSTLREDMVNRRAMLQQRLEAVISSFRQSGVLSHGETKKSFEETVERNLQVLPPPAEISTKCVFLHSRASLESTILGAANRCATRGQFRKETVGDVPDRGGRPGDVRQKQMRESVGDASKSMYGRQPHGAGQRGRRENWKQQKGQKREQTWKQQNQGKYRKVETHQRGGPSNASAGRRVVIVEHNRH